MARVKGLVKENSKCKVCQSWLNRPGVICDECVVVLYMLAIWHGTTLKVMAERYGLRYKTVRDRYYQLRQNGDYERLRIRAYRKFTHIIGLERKDDGYR